MNRPSTTFPDLTSHPLRRMPAYLINGVGVSVGIACVRLLLSAVAGPHAAQLAAGGAIGSSLADQAVTSRRTVRRVLLAVMLSFSAALMVAVLGPHPLLLGLGIALFGGAAMLLMAWGPAAGPLSFVPILTMIFAMAAPSDPSSPLRAPLWTLAGGLTYLGWTWLSSRLLERRYRTLSVAQAIAASAHELRTRSQLLRAGAQREPGAGALGEWVKAEAALAEQLQGARDFVYPSAPGAEYRRNTALMHHIFEVRDQLVASRIDMHLLGNDAAGTSLQQRAATALALLADELDAAAARLRGLPSQRAALPDDLVHSRWFSSVHLAPGDPRERLLATLANRQRHLLHEVQRIHALLDGEQGSAPLGRDELLQFVTPESWRLSDLRAQLSWHSPVLRHALRTAVALGSAYYLARALPGASHPQWLVLSVAVVLRGNLEQTLARRNMRIVGTLLGCALVLALLALRSTLLLEACFLIAIGVAHAFAFRRYWLTATAATVMALLQVHLVDPAAGLPIAERTADTLLGALLAWGFSYVLPSWERRRLPQACARARDALLRYGVYTLQAGSRAAVVAQRLARRRAYDALNDLGALLQRSSAEPRNVRVPDVELALMLDHAQRYMAHLSVVRLTLTRRAADLPPGFIGPQVAATCAALQARLEAATPAHNDPDAISDEADSLPLESPDANLRPWVQRRLQLLVHEAGLIRAACDLALSKAGRSAV
jgi:uncharacterized membrane protein YccC